MQWKVAKELQDSEGVEWVRFELGDYDWSECEWITLRRGAWGGPGTRYDEAAGGWTSPVAGLCRHPVKGKHGYRINCRVNTRLGWPAYNRQRVSPLYRNPDGSWPPVPQGHRTGEWLQDPKTGREWQRLYRLTPLDNEDEAFVYIVAHEAFHYLRRTRQLSGRNTEIDADAFGFETLERYRNAA